VSLGWALTVELSGQRELDWWRWEREWDTCEQQSQPPARLSMLMIPL
jgi:hypothetical protein